MKSEIRQRRAGSKAEGVKAGDDFLKERIAGNFFPRLIAGDADEELVAVTPEAVVEGEAEKFKRRPEAVVVDDLSVVEMPIPDVLRVTFVGEEAVFGGWQGVAGKGKRFAAAGRGIGLPAGAGPAGVGCVRGDETDGGLSGGPVGEIDGELLLSVGSGTAIRALDEMGCLELCGEAVKVVACHGFPAGDVRRKKRGEVGRCGRRARGRTGVENEDDCEGESGEETGGEEGKLTVDGRSLRGGSGDGL